MSNQIPGEGQIRDNEIESIFSAAPDGVIVIDREGKIVRWNLRSEALFGWSSPEVIGKFLHDMIIPIGYREAHKKGMRRYLDTGETSVMGRTIRVRALKKNGEEFDVALSISPTEVSGKLMFIGFIRDITLEKKAEQEIIDLNDSLEKRVLERTEELERSEKKYRDLFHHNPLPIWIVDGDDFTFLDVNTAACLHYGYTREEFLSMTEYSLGVPDGYIEEASSLAAIINSDTGNKEVRKHVKKDGGVMDMELHADEILFEGRRARLVLANDITEKLKGQEKQALYSAIVDSSNDAIISRTLGGIIRSWNRGAEVLFGYNAQEAIGKGLSLIIPPHLLKEEEDLMARIVMNENIKNYETSRVRKNGTVIPISLTVSPIKDINGRIIGASKIAHDITDRKQAEEKLKRSLQEVSDYKYALDESSIIAITDQKGVITYVNENFRRVSKFQDSEVIGRDYNLIDSGYHSKEFIRAIRIMLTKGKIWKGELKNKASDGTTYWVDTTIVPFLDEQGLPYQYIAIQADITKRKEAEEALAKSEKRFRALIENSKDIISISDKDFKPIYRSPSVERITGYAAGDPDNKGGEDSIFSEDLPLLKETINNILQHPGQSFPLQFRMKHKKGHYIWLEGIMTNMLHDEFIGGIISNFRDITESKITEEKLIRSEKIYKTIASSIPGCAICLLDNEYRYFLVEGDFIGQIGYSEEDLLGKELKEVVPEEQYTRMLPYLERVFAGETFTLENNRGEIYTISRFVPLKDEKDNVYAAMVVVLDITELKEAEKNIAELNIGLEQKVRERTMQLEMVNSELEAFTYSVSHDLRAPLRIINGFADILITNHAAALDIEGKKVLGVINKNVERMRRLIDDLLNLSRLGRKEVVRKNVDMNEMVRCVIDELEQGQKQTVEFDIKSLLPAYCDSSLLEVVWTNLISNAVKYSGKIERPVINISSSGENEEIIYSISDNGVGFDMLYADKLFRVFQRLHSSKEFEGTGVGLALVERIIMKHGGRVWAYGETDKGATFNFSLPEKPGNQ